MTSKVSSFRVDQVAAPRNTSDLGRMCHSSALRKKQDLFRNLL